ncbi:MAG: phosphatidylglycerophosphatase A [Legionellaceae bacterium]|nr:phosphatidylglycerophosphatase A [Legionellaceae bacterium]
MLSYVQMRIRVFQNPHYFMAFGFGSGLARFAPGTWGTLAAIPLYLLMAHLTPFSYAMLCLLGLLYGVWCCGYVADALGVHDYKGIVWDEIVGYWFTMALVPPSFAAVLWGFILFRFFDITKPPPIRWVDQQVHGGLGIMLDDVLAAVPAALMLWGMSAGGLL